MKTALLFPLTLIMLTVSCVSKQKYDELEKKVKLLESQNIEFKQNLTECIDSKTPSATPTYEYQDEVKESPKIELSKYAFVVLEVKEETGWTREGGVITYRYKTYN